MLDPNSYLRTFVEKMTEMNGGRAFFTNPQNLGDYVLVDFLETSPPPYRHPVDGFLARI